MFIHLGSYRCFGRAFVERFAVDGALFLHHRRTRSLKAEERAASTAADGEGEGGSAKKKTKLAIGVEGGFKTEEQKYDVTEQWSLAVAPNFDDDALLPLNVVKDASITDNSKNNIYTAHPELPEMVNIVIKDVLAYEDAGKQEQYAAAAWSADSIPLKESKVTLALPCVALL